MFKWFRCETIMWTDGRKRMSSKEFPVLCNIFIFKSSVGISETSPTRTWSHGTERRIKMKRRRHGRFLERIMFIPWIPSVILFSSCKEVDCRVQSPETVLVLIVYFQLLRGFSWWTYSGHATWDRLGGPSLHRFILFWSLVSNIFQVEEDNVGSMEF